MATYRQCNKCREFWPVATVPKVQIFGKLYPIGSVLCLCKSCRDMPLDGGQRYIILGDNGGD